MNEPSNDNITGQPPEGPRSDEIIGDPRRGGEGYEVEEWPVFPPKNKTLLYVVLGVGISVLLLILVIGLVFPAIATVRQAAGRTQSIGNCKQICLALNNMTSCGATGSIPPSYGPFPFDAGGANQSFFVSLLPFIEQNDLYASWASNTSTPVLTYIAPADPNNPGTHGLISYGSNATLLTVGGSPTMPRSFNGRTSSIIVVFERTAKSGSTWSSSNSYLIDKNGSSSPEFTRPSSWSSYGTKATALTSVGCVVGLGDGSSRVVTQGSANAGWAWAMDPSIPGTQAPSGW